jgi:imidazolonepropionase-like amidohydrolase
MNRVVLAVIFAAAFAPVTGALADESFTVLMGKGPSGTMEVKQDPDGGRRTEYGYNDRGRGPETVTVERLDARGLPVSLTIKGVDYLKAPVDEHFALENGKATWESGADEGSGVAAQGRIYVPNLANSEDLAVLARALLAAPGHELDLLPRGHARIAKVDVPEIGGGQLYLIDGLGFQPSPVWLDAQGELVFEGSSWLSAVRKGAEAFAPQFISAQQKVIAERAAARAKTLQRRPQRATAFVHATLFDSVSRKLLPNTTVVVEDGKISAVGADGTVKIPRKAEVVDASGKTLMPGLADMHVHIGDDTDGLLDILAGVTTVRDLGNDMDELLARRKKFADGTLVGPRIWPAGIIDGPGKYAGPTKVLVSTPEQAKAAVAMYAEHGYPQVKIYSSVDPKLVPVIVAEAHARGLRVSGHVPAGMTMTEAVEAGYDEVQHANFWFLNFMGPEVTAKTNTIVRLTATANHARDLDLDSPKVAKFVDLLKAHRIVVDPTVSTFEDDFVDKPRMPARTVAAWSSRLPPAVARSVSGGGLAKSEEERLLFAQSFRRMLEFTRKLHDAGITIVAGTDAMAGLPLSRELENYVRAGIPSDEVLQIATLGAARVMGHDKEQGSIEPGKNADLILIDGDPVADINDIRKVGFVMKDGVVYDLPGIARALGMKPR